MFEQTLGDNEGREGLHVKVGLHTAVHGLSKSQTEQQQQDYMACGRPREKCWFFFFYTEILCEVQEL